jgi:hypothetical protein
MSDSSLFFSPRLDRLCYLLLIVFAATAMIFFSLRAAVGVAVGGVISIVNFHWLKQAIDFVILKGAEGKVGKRVGLQYAGRYALIALVLFVTIRFSIADPVYVMAGLMIYVLAVLLEAVLEIAKTIIRDYPNGKV